MTETITRGSSTKYLPFIFLSLFSCAAATVVYGSFSFLSLLYEQELDDADSTNFKELSQLLSTEIERELYSFSLSGRFEATVEDFSNRYFCSSVVISLANSLRFSQNVAVTLCVAVAENYYSDSEHQTMQLVYTH